MQKIKRQWGSLIEIRFNILIKIWLKKISNHYLQGNLKNHQIQIFVVHRVVF